MIINMGACPNFRKRGKPQKDPSYNEKNVCPPYGKKT